MQARPEVFASSEPKPAAAAPAAAEPETPEVGGPAVRRRQTSDTVTVCCKHPQGYVLRLHVNKPAQELTPLGTRDIPGGIWEPSDEPPVLINGNGINISLMKKGEPSEHAMVGGYALTPNVSRAFWEQWCEQNARHPALVKGMMWASDDASVRDFARDGAKVRSGLEPIDPDNPGLTTGMGKVIEAGDQPRGR